jgi:TonB family protein
MKRAKADIRKSWHIDVGLIGDSLEADVLVRLTESGDLVEVRMTRPSGDAAFDDSLEEAIRAASPLPPPPSADAWTLRFRPNDAV